MKPASYALFLASTVAVFSAAGCQQHAVLPAPPPTAALAPTDLQSPWDTTPVQPAEFEFGCPPAMPLGPDIVVTTSLNNKPALSEDVKEAVYSQSSQALRDTAARVVAAADVYRNTGNMNAARCVSNILTAAASDMAMTGYVPTTEGWNEHNLALRAFALAYLKVRPSGVVDPEHARVITLWLNGLAREERDYVEHLPCEYKHCPTHSHTGLNIAVAAAAAGIASDDGSLFHWAVSEYRSAVSMISPEGTLHYDNRGRWAEKWNLESAAAMVQIAEFGEVNGEPLYGYDNGRVHVLVHTVALGLVDASLYKNITHASQVTYTPIPAWEVVWASVYNRRFPDPVLTGLLHQVGPVPVDMWGGEPWAPEDES